MEERRVRPFSIAGLRNSLDDERGNLTLEFVRLANAIDDLRSSGTIIVWENVPGVLSVKDNAFGCFLAALVGDDTPLVPPRGKWPNAGLVAGPKRRAAWRILDAQYFGVPQRRRRVFVVASARDDFDPAEVLFEREGVQRHSAPRREKGQGTSTDVAPSLVSSGRGVERTGETRGQDPVVAVYHDVAHCLNAGGMGRIDYETESFVVAPEIARTLTRGAESAGKGGYAGRRQEDDDNIVAHTLRAEGFDASGDGSGRGTPIVPVAFDLRNGTQDHVTMSLQSGGMGDERGLCPNAVPHTLAPVAFDMRGREGGGQLAAATQMAVRRLTPRECERLQGFPDGYTAINIRGKPAADGPRYKALGNSMAVPVMRWIGKRIQNR